MTALQVLAGYAAIAVAYIVLEPVVIGALFRTHWERHRNVSNLGARMRVADEDSAASGRIVVGLLAVLASIGWTLLVFRYA